MRVILASSSPSRLEILRSAGVEPEVVVSHVDEEAAAAELSDPTPEEYVQHLAECKAAAVQREGVVIGADSMLLIDGMLQGKPHTEEETIARWRYQRGKTAQLITGHALVLVGAGGVEKKYSATARTTIHFAEATDADIAAYAATGEPFGCAGAFTLEALGGWFIDRIEGDPSSVIGLSLPVVRRGLAEFGLNASNVWNR